MLKYKLKSMNVNPISINYSENVNILLEISKNDYENKLLKYINREQYNINSKILQKKFVDISTKTKWTWKIF